MSLVLTAHQCVYWPWLGLLDKIARADAFVSFDAVQQEDSGFENRTRIRCPGSAQGWQWLTVPVRRSRDARLCDLEIASEHNWQRKHWRAIEMAYGKAPHWAAYGPQLASFFRDRDWLTLAEVDDAAQACLRIAFGIGEQRVETLSRLITEGQVDGTLRGSALVLAMCQALGATKYIFGACGRDYADVAAFERAGIEVEFQDLHEPDYPGKPQGLGVPLSALDALLWAGPDWARSWIGGIRR
jgi:hypothetical protein